MSGFASPLMFIHYLFLAWWGPATIYEQLLQLPFAIFYQPQLVLEGRTWEVETMWQQQDGTHRHGHRRRRQVCACALVSLPVKGMQHRWSGLALGQEGNTLVTCLFLALVLSLVLNG